MSTTVRLCVASCLLFSTVVVYGVRRDVDPETSSTKLLAVDEKARCVDIAPSLSSCRRLGYRQMRLPSLLNDTVVNASSSAAVRAFVDDCGKDGLVLMCSLLAPVCLDRPIWPCASLCRNVSSACRRASSTLDLATLIDCDMLPTDDQLCIGPNSTGRKVSSSAETDVFDVRIPPSQRRPGVTANGRRRRRLKARRGASSRRSIKPSVRRTRKWNAVDNVETAAEDDAATVADSVNTTVMTSCTMCAEQLTVRALTTRLCAADFVAKVQPSRYIRAGDNLKLLASRSTKFYKSPTSSSLSSRRRVVFFLLGGGGDSATHCACLHAAGGGVVDGRPPRRRRRGGGGRGGAGRDGGLLVAGRVDEVGARQRRTRPVVTSVLPLGSRTLVRRAIRLTRNEDVCERRTSRPRDGRRGRRRQRRPDQPTALDDQSDEQPATTGRRRDSSKRSRQQRRGAVDRATRTMKRKLLRSTRGRRQRN